MKKKSKIILFLACFVFFVLAAPLTIFYSQGYRFDFKEKKITQTGGLFLKIKPKKANIYVDGKIVKETDFLFGSALIENLLPGKYKVTALKDGFQKWEKNLLIEEKKVTEAKNIILWPKDPSPKMIAGKIKKLSLVLDQKKAIFLQIEKGQPNFRPATSSPAQTGEKQNLKLYDLERKVKSHLIGSDDFKEKEIEFLDIIWLPGSQNVLLEIAAQEQLNPVRESEENGDLIASDFSNGVKYFLLQILPRPKLIPLTFLPKDLSKVDPHPQEPQKIFFQRLQRNSALSSLFEADLKEKKISPGPLLKGFVAFALTEKNLYWLTPDGFVYKSDLLGQGKEKINKEPLKLQGGETGYKILVNQDNVFLQEGENLFYLKPETGSFEKIFEGVALIAFSPDNKKLALAKEHEIWLYFTEKELSQPQREKGEKVFLTRFGQKIDKISWVSSHYLLFEIEDKIKIIEIDDRDKAQIWNLAEFKEPEIFFSPNSKNLYILTEEKLFASEPLF